MKSLTKLMAMGLLSVGLAACSSDDEGLAQGGQSLNDGDNVYMSLNLSFPESRATGTPDYEIGSKEENAVQTVQIILTDSQGQIVTTSESVTGWKGTSVSNNNKRFTARFNANKLKALAGKTDLKLYAVCNGKRVDPLHLSDAVNALAAGDFSALANESYWSNSTGFLMANAEGAVTTSLPDEATLLLNNSTPESPYSLGLVPVQRAAARFDYKGMNETNTYDIDTQDGVKVATINLQGATLANVSRNFYTFVRSNADGATGTPAVLGNGSFIVDTDWSTPVTSMQFVQGTTATPDIDAGVGCYVNYKYSDIDQLVTAGQDDAWEGTPSAERNQYKVWSYASENTVPADAAYGVKGAVTAVVFKGVIEATDAASAELKAALASDEPVVVYDNKLLGSWAMIQAMVDADDVTAAQHPFKDDQSGFDLFKGQYELAKAAATALGKPEITPSIARQYGFTVYKTDGNKNHEVYYYYWNKHDANMTYGVVRNNVYKLKVNEILKYGFPRNGSINPEEPIDSKDIYFKMSVDVLPWAVKVNDIEF